MKFNIRQAQLSDVPYVYDICRKTGNNGQDATDLLSDHYIIGQYFAAPYLHFELEACFVLEYNRIPVGYVIGTSDTQKFNTWMNDDWLPQIRRHYSSDMAPRSDLEKFVLEVIHTECTIPDFLSDYPSHLHIDLLPIAQKKGFGKRMISAFTKKLKDMRSTGLHLSVGENNLNAIGFYKRIGFKELNRASGSVTMGIPIA
ncbi:MAG: GNAT family N-acetyltransferase [Cytophagales bacterium]|nr:GNAT family N-acetyltransferase [Cytophagales bacterium]